MGTVINKGEFSLLGLRLKIQIITEFGKLVKSKREKNLQINIYRIYNFYVASYYNYKTKLVERVEILDSRSLVILLLTDST